MLSSYVLSRLELTFSERNVTRFILTQNLYAIVVHDSRISVQRESVNSKINRLCAH